MPERVFNKPYQFTFGYEGGLNFDGFQDDGQFGHVFCNRVNVLQLYQNDVNGLALFKGFPNESFPGIFGQQFNFDDDDGIRGHLIPSGKLDVKANVLLSGRFHFPHNFTFSMHLPVISMELHDVRFRDRTQNVRFEDLLVKELLTDNFSENVRQHGGPCLTGWNRTGVGDFVTMVRWMRNFPQMKPALKNVRLITRGALSWPTGKQRDEDLLLALPFGNDGAVGLIFGAGLDLTFAEMLRGGGYVEFLYQFSDLKQRRIKTDLNQTDLFFIAKETAFKSHGISEQFNLYLQAWRFWHGMSAKVAYQFYKKRDDRLWIFSDLYDQNIANTAEDLLDATYHNIIFFLMYNFDPFGQMAVSPNLYLFAKHGFNGKRAIVGNTLGFTLSVSF